MRRFDASPPATPLPRRVALLALAAAALGGACRGNRSEDPPVHLNPNMDRQERFEAQDRNPLFDDRRAMRPQVPGTVAAGGARAAGHFYRGVVRGEPAQELPLQLSATLLSRGQERYDIFCGVCHGGAGTGDAIAVQRGLIPPPSYHEPRIRQMPVGTIYAVVSDGIRNMASYASQIPPGDRWAIVAYVRALQVSRSAALDDVPADIAESKGWTR